MLRFLFATLLLAACADLDATQQQPRVVISEVMANPSAVPDETGEWFEVWNRGSAPVDLRGWSIASGNDKAVVVGRALVVPAGGRAVLARGDAVAGAFVYGRGISLGNTGDWLALRDRRGATADSVAWRSAPAGASYRPAQGKAPVAAAPPAAPASGRELVVRVLDVGQGDATLITNGGSRVLIDGGPDARRMGEILDSLELNRSTIDVVILSHPHFDHHAGLRELFRRSRGITVRYFFENGDPYTNGALRQLRDSVAARRGRGELVYRRTDDPCGDGRPVCTLSLRGGARLHVMKPFPRGEANDRSTPVKLVGPDSASFSMWLAGDAEHDALRWFDTGAGYDTSPGMRVTVLKANHHGSCNGVSERYLRLTSPEVVALSLAARNDYGHAHAQAKALYSRAGIPWYRTDQNGTITFRSPGTPGGGYTVAVQRGARGEPGPSDRRSTQSGCNPMP